MTSIISREMPNVTGRQISRMEERRRTPGSLDALASDANAVSYIYIGIAEN